MKRSHSIAKVKSKKKTKTKTNLVVDKDKPSNFGLWFLISGLLLMMFCLNMVDYPMFFLLLSSLTWDTFLTLRGTWGFYLNRVLPPLRPSKTYGEG